MTFDRLSDREAHTFQDQEENIGGGGGAKYHSQGQSKEQRSKGCSTSLASKIGRSPQHMSQEGPKTQFLQSMLQSIKVDLLFPSTQSSRTNRSTRLIYSYAMRLQDERPRSVANADCRCSL
nr:hypothetical protein CFP56_10263 [Quercus suber]